MGCCWKILTTPTLKTEKVRKKCKIHPLSYCVHDRTIIKATVTKKFKGKYFHQHLLTFVKYSIHISEPSFFVLFYHSFPVIQNATAEIIFLFWCSHPVKYGTLTHIPQPPFLLYTNFKCFLLRSGFYRDLYLSLHLFSPVFHITILFSVIPFNSQPYFGFLFRMCFLFKTIFTSQFVIIWLWILIHSPAAPVSSFVPNYFLCIIFSLAGMHRM